MFTGEEAPAWVKAVMAPWPKWGSQIAWAMGRTCRGSVTHCSKLPCQAMWNRLPETQRPMMARCPKWVENSFW